MDGFKDSTKMKYMSGGMVDGYAMGGGTKPMMKGNGGSAKMPLAGESVKSGNRMSKMTAAEMRAMEPRTGSKKMPSAGESVKSGNRMSKEGADEARFMGVYKKGGLAAMSKKGKC